MTPKTPAAVEINKVLDHSGQKFSVIISEMERAPIDKKLPLPGATSSKATGSSFVVATKKALYTFDVDFAGISAIEYKDIVDDSGLFVNSFGVGSKKALAATPLLLLDDQGYPIFILKEKVFGDTETSLIFEANYKNWHILKTIILKQESFEVDVLLDLEPKAGAAEISKPRFVFMAPVEQAVAAKAVGFSNDVSFSDLSFAKDSDYESSAWKLPVLFGAHDRFFVHTFINDSPLASNVRRAWYSSGVDQDSLGRLLFLELPPVKEKISKLFKFYFGPKKSDLLMAAHPLLDKTLSFGFLSVFCKPLLGLLDWLFEFVKNYGFAIILMSFLLRLPFFPVLVWARRRMAKIESFEYRYAREIADINRKYASNFSIKAEHLAKFYADHGQSQMGKWVAILPNLLQIPIMFALYRVLLNSIALYNAKFLLWIVDLSSPDQFYILPMLLGLMSFIHQTVMMPAAAGGAGASQAKMMRYIMPAVLFFIFAKLPAGLVLYWICNNFFAVLEDFLFKRFFLRNQSTTVVL